MWTAKRKAAQLVQTAALHTATRANRSRQPQLLLLLLLAAASQSRRRRLQPRNSSQSNVNASPKSKPH